MTATPPLPAVPPPITPALRAKLIGRLIVKGAHGELDAQALIAEFTAAVGSNMDAGSIANELAAYKAELFASLTAGQAHIAQVQKELGDLG